MSKLKYEYITLRMDVKLTDGYRGNWRAAVDEAKRFSVEYSVIVKLHYARQYVFTIDPDTDVEAIKKRQLVVGV